MQQAQQPPRVPPRVLEARRFLAQRGLLPGHRPAARVIGVQRPSSGVQLRSKVQSQAATGAASSATWQSLGPTAVQTADFGLVTGRVAALALDPSDGTGNRLYVGTTGGGVWMSNNAGVSTPSSIVFTPLTDSVAALSGAADASISIGALTVQPGATGVILAGTGDPNDDLDSYYGAGILRSTDGGNTWSLIQQTADKETGLSNADYNFAGLGFAGFAWSTANPQLVVAAVSQAFEGTLVDANWRTNTYQGLYYSTDSGATWHLATITDGGGQDVQGPMDLVSPPGNAATAVVWNPVRQLFFAAVRYHGYYQSADGVTWTRLGAQPGAGLSAAMCPTNSGKSGSIACPIFRGALAVNPQTGDTFAWTVDLNNQDQGLWQDLCGVNRSGTCGNNSIVFSQLWNTAALETNTLEGPATIANGNYNLALAAVPAGQQTMVLAGANDLWQTTCPVSQGCAWRNTTNSTTCMSAQVAEFQHALAWDTANPQEVFLGNDSGLWRSTDGIGESGPVCSSTDASHFQNLNGSLGPLAEVVGLSPIVSSQYVMMAGLGVNGTAGVKNSTATADWPQILSGYGGPVAVEPNQDLDWYVNTEPGVAIFRCSQLAPCTPAAFGTSPVVTDADVSGDGYAMPTPAPFIVDPLDASQLLIGTCRVWRGPANGVGWSAANAISPVLDNGATGVSCNGDALIRAMGAMQLASGNEIIYVGMYGAAYNGSDLPGHVLSAIVNPSSSTVPTWNDLTLNTVVNETNTLNEAGFDISNLTIDAHDTTGNTVYATVAGTGNPASKIQLVYRSTNGGATWTNITANLPPAPANSLAIDPQNANTVYIATDQGVYFTTAVGSCGQQSSNCWSVFGTGLPGAPAVALSAASLRASEPVLVAATYGRGIWQTPLWSAETDLTSAAASPASLAYSSQVFGTASSPLTVTLNNTGNLALLTTSVTMTGNFSETDTCVNQTIAAGASCAIQVTFTPQATGPLSGEMTIYANVYGGQLTVDLTGTGAPAGVVSLTPSTVSFGQVQVGTASSQLPVTAANSSATAIPISSVTVTPPFTIASNSCGTANLAANSSCQVLVKFEPTQAGPVAGLLTFTDGAGTQTAELTGTGMAPPADVLNPTSLTFPATGVGQLSTAQTVTITNFGGEPLTSIFITASAQFHETNTCTTQLSAGAVCTISVEFAPTQTGAVSGTLTISDSLHTQTVTLSGTGLAPPSFSVNPTSLTFNNQQPGVASAPQMLTVTNAGGTAMANVGFAFSGAAAANYSVASTTCGASLASGSSCTAQIVFTPSATGAVSASLAISSSTSGVVPATVPLNGSGQLAAGLTTNASQLTFQVVGTGQPSAAQTVTITNSSSYAIAALTLVVTAPFSVAQNTCTGGLAAGANCTVSVLFQPTATGSASGSLTASSASVATPASVALFGTGFDFTVTVTGPASQTVVRGQQADYTLGIAPAGAGESFTFACGTLPANTICIFNPPTQTLNAGVQGTVQVEISTASGSTARVERPEPARPGSGGSGFWHTAPFACGLLLLPFAVRKRGRVFLLLVFFAILVGGVSSCTSSGGGTGGGGTGGQGGGSGTPTGTYTIPVNVTSTGITHSVNVSLTVD